MKIDLNTIIIIAGLVFIFLYFDKCKPATDIGSVQMEQKLWEDSARMYKATADSLQGVNDTLKIQLIMTEAAFEVAYTKYSQSVDNVKPVRKKHEEIRNKLLQLGSDDAIRLLARRAAAIDSLRQRVAQGR